MAAGAGGGGGGSASNLSTSGLFEFPQLFTS